MALPNRGLARSPAEKTLAEKTLAEKTLAGYARNDYSGGLDKPTFIALLD
jgi:hypothetical protein